MFYQVFKVMFKILTNKRNIFKIIYLDNILIYIDKKT